MAPSRPVRWLHLSDLHLGCRGREIWWQMHEELGTSIRQMVGRLGPPDLVLLTGDLTNIGTHDEFELVDQFLDDLLGWLREGTSTEPLLLAVPGNHDLIRPQGREQILYRPLGRWFQGEDDPDVKYLTEELWDKRDPSFVDPLFSGYRTWFERRVRPGIEQRASSRNLSHFPCDFSATVSIDDAFPLTIVGLNSTWQQYTDGDFERRLLIPARQFQAAMGDGGTASPLEVFRKTPRALLLMHQPPSWLAPRGRAVFHESIFSAHRFDLCLYGHLHEGRAEEIQVSGGARRCYFQSPSLFGLEHYGTSREERAIGYSWGSLSEDGTVRVWPLRRVRRGGGEWAFDRDQDFPDEPLGVVIGGPLGVSSGVPARVPKVDLGPYLRDLVKRTDHIPISGIVTAAKGALRPSIEQLYTPLSSRGGLDPDLGEAALRGQGSERLSLSELLPRHPRLLLEGQPGAGKTTFLRFVACMLARDLLGEPCPGGGPWRQRHLGYAPSAPALVPILVRVADLADLLKAEEPPKLKHDSRRRLLDLLALSCEENEHAVPREEWQRRLEGGEALLLLDGLDEVDDEKLRERVFAIFRDATQEWKCPIVVASRPLATEPLRAMGFHVATVDPFGDGEIRTFLDHWVAALHESDPSAPGTEALRHRDALADAILARPAVRRLATNPVMLTCLCVVHWSQGRLPEARSRVYEAVIGWLIQSRTELRAKAGFTDLFAKEAFARLAFAMMTTELGKVSGWDVGEAAKAVAPLLVRDTTLASEPARLAKARRWLLFEGGGSGIVEELAGRRVKFWHLTFQEYLAAVHLASLGEDEQGDGHWWPVLTDQLDAAQWRETVELFPGTLLEGGSRRVDLLLERVLAKRGKRPGLAEEAKAAGILGRLLVPLEVLKYQSSQELAASYRQALGRSLAIFTAKGAAEVPFMDRLAAAEALGQGGDPRLAPGVDNFREVAGLGGLRLGKYPVTVEEYRLFVEAGGYEEGRFWSASGWQERQERDWQEPAEWAEQLGHPSRPVVGVSWYEAESYCRWLSEQRGAEARLPTAAEWEVAATRKVGEYPWGEGDPGPDLANFKRQVGSPTPVGLYPAGDGPFGHSDLAGNVWEWCADEEGEVGRVLKGGGWGGPAVDLRSAIRLRLHAWYRSVSVGFRVAVSPPSR